jgi:hypothetical protein
MIKKYPFNSFYVIAEYEHHDKIKNEIMTMIDESEYQTRPTGIQTDFFVNHSIHKPWAQKFFEHAMPYLSQTYKELGYTEISINGIWFQRYSKMIGHNWHTHGKTNFSTVYYLDVPENSAATAVKEPFDQESIVYEGSEGTFSIFPAYAIHCATPNMSDQERTVIAFNVDVECD